MFAQMFFETSFFFFFFKHFRDLPWAALSLSTGRTWPAGRSLSIPDLGSHLISRITSALGLLYNSDRLLENSAFEK
jgi:hypothetical protein